MFPVILCSRANNWTNINVQWNHHWLWSQVLTAHNTLNSCTMSQWARDAHGVSCVTLVCTTLPMSIYAKMPCSNLRHKVLTSDMHSTWGLGSQTSHKAHFRVGTHSSKLWPYVSNRAKSRGWALFLETTIYTYIHTYIHTYIYSVSWRNDLHW